jgi:hypothetical protein
VHFGGRKEMQCQAPDAPQCARYGQQYVQLIPVLDLKLHPGSSAA